MKAWLHYFFFFNFIYFSSIFYLIYFLFIFNCFPVSIFFFFLLHGMQDLSSLTVDWTWFLGIKSEDS